MLSSSTGLQLFCTLLLSAQALDAAVPTATRDVLDRILRAKGVHVADEGVYKFVIPHEAAVMPSDDETMSPNLGFNSWIGFTPATHEEAAVAGEFLLLEDEVNPVLTTLLAGRLQVTGLAQSTVFDGPRWFTLNFNGVGDFQQLASDVRRGLDAAHETRRTAAVASHRKASVALPKRNSIDGAPLDTILAMRGAVVGGVYRAAIGRRVLLRGETVGREMGMSTWVSLAGSNERALGQVELIATAEELQRVLATICRSGMNVTSIRNHTIGEHPQAVFVRFWAEGAAFDLARSIRHILEVQVGATAR